MFNIWCWKFETGDMNYWNRLNELLNPGTWIVETWDKKCNIQHLMLKCWKLEKEMLKNHKIFETGESKYWTATWCPASSPERLAAAQTSERCRGSAGGQGGAARVEVQGSGVGGRVGAAALGGQWQRGLEEEEVEVGLRNIQRWVIHARISNSGRWGSKNLSEDR